MLPFRPNGLCTPSHRARSEKSSIDPEWACASVPRSLQLDLAVYASRQSLIPEVLEREHERPQPAEHFCPDAQSSPRLREASKSFRLCLQRSPSLLAQLTSGRSRALDARNDTAQNEQTDINSLFCKLADAKKLLDPEGMATVFVCLFVCLCVWLVGC